MTESPPCSRCGKKGLTISMSVTGSGREPTPPICMDCFKKATKRLVGEKEV